MFDLRDRVIEDYKSYVQSFLNIRDSQIEEFVNTKLNEGALWPDVLIQLNPAYEYGPTIKELVDRGILHPFLGNIFPEIRLYLHQYQAIELALKRQHYVVTTGTGSGKSLTYLIPIFDHILKNNPEDGRVRAIIVYPMNALINSQYESIERLANKLSEVGFPIKFKRYTGQESEEEKRSIQNNPPHILLTNYVMLELMLTRTAERAFVDRTAAALEFLVLDELHTYRGRQGADVALLVRRLRERCGNPNLLCIGTSATMAAGGTRAERREAVAEVASKIFGVEVKPENVIDESLKRVIPRSVSYNKDDLIKALQDPLPKTKEEFLNSPLSAWIEDTFGVREEEGFLRRCVPITLDEGVKRLAKETGLSYDLCLKRLKEMFLQAVNYTRPDGDGPLFAFKLHQFVSQGGAVYATLEPKERRYLTFDGQHYAPGAERILFPLAFCRECGQEYYLVEWHLAENKLLPRYPRISTDSDEVKEGYLLLDEEGIWNGDLESLPENWFTTSSSGQRKVKREYRDFIPKCVYVKPNGEICHEDDDEAVLGWFLPKPFLFCLWCGVVYTKRNTNDFRKLTHLSNEGRSSATTILSISALTYMRQTEFLDKKAQKILSFTDNRQDASLQAGHFNDFVKAGLLRGAMYRALKAYKILDHTDIAVRVTEALGLDQEDYAKEVGIYGSLSRRNKEALQDLIEYRIYEELRSGWRIVQPNLEQCGLMRINYKGLKELCEDEIPWQAHPLLASLSSERRFWIIFSLLDYMRHNLALHARCLDPDYQDSLRRRVREMLKDPWTFEEREWLEKATTFVLPGYHGSLEDDEYSLGPRSSIARFLRDKKTWGVSANLSEDEYEMLLKALVEILRGAGFLIEVESQSGRAVQLRSDCLLWELGDGNLPEPNPIRSRRVDTGIQLKREINAFFRDFYISVAQHLHNLEGREHTGQVSSEKRKEREELFNQGKLSALFCSPTMELGIDIAELNLVHLRNVPPTPANYAQRSGRAGRSGQPALILTYCASGSGHDQYFFRRPQDMVAGAVAPARLDLGNEELVKAHVHAIWLAFTGVSFKSSMVEILDTSNVAENYPLRDEIKAQLQLSPERMEKCLEHCKAVLATCGSDLSAIDWYSEEWLRTVLKNAVEDFDRSCDRWRFLFSTADKQLREARAIIDRAHISRVSRDELEEARRREKEALRQKDILCCNDTKPEESDFYPYRYLASEGFLPGYNFPRLPVRAYLPVGDEGEFIARPRFLAIVEFAPRNIIYHEGNKYRITRCLLQPGAVEERCLRAKLCRNCGYLYEGGDLVDICENCGTEFDGENSEYLTKLFELTTVAGRRVERITCDEEERLREGYEVTTHFKFAPYGNGSRRFQALVKDEDGKVLLEMVYGPAATLWRINHGWRRSREPGFALDTTNGVWARRPNAYDEDSGDIDTRSLVTGVRLLVRDTRNILLVKPAAEYSLTIKEMAALQYALQRGIESLFQIEEGELSSERIGRNGFESILFWEATEGGVGILRRLVMEPKTLSRVARTALEICHFDPNTGLDLAADRCTCACYECLLTYTNQPDHALLDRHSIKSFLMELSKSVTEVGSVNRSYEEHYKWLREQTDPASVLERRFLDHLYATRRLLPDYAQKKLDDYPCKPDFYYEKGHGCVFCDGSVHDRPQQRAEDEKIRRDLADMGYRVVVIRYDEDLEEQIRRYRDIFGEGNL